MLVGIVGVLHSEPWPAFVLPGFKSVYEAKGQVEITSPKFFVKWQNSHVSKKEIAASTLFSGLQQSQLQGFIRSNFSQTDYSPEARNWLKKRLLQIYPDSSIAALEVAWIPISYQPMGDSIQVSNGESTQTITIPLNNK